MRFARACLILLTGLVVMALLLFASHRQALLVEREVLKPSLSTARSYNRLERLNALDPWTSLLPHWTITYFEAPADRRYDSPSITVNLFGRVVDWRSKEVAILLTEKGYNCGD